MPKSNSGSKPRNKKINILSNLVGQKKIQNYFHTTVREAIIAQMISQILTVLSYDGLSKENRIEDKRVEPSIYAGESSRSLRECTKEHHRNYDKKGESSHMLKHWAGAHPDSARPSFNMYVVGAYKSCMDRQI